VTTVLCNELRNVGINVTFVCLEKNDFYSITNEIHYLSEYTGFGENQVTKLYALYLCASRLKTIIKRENISIVQSHMYRANYVNVLAGLLGSPHRTQLVNHGIVSRYKNEGLGGRINLFLIKHLYGRADQLVFPSIGMKDDLDRLGTFTNNKVVIHNPFDVNGILEEKDAPLDEGEFRFDPTGRYLVAAGRFEKVKRYCDLIEALELLKESGVDIELILLGEGPEKEHLIGLAARLGLQDAVHFPGRVMNPFKYISRADLLVSASEYEGFSNVIVEALICGTPVVSSDCASGPREILAPGSAEGRKLNPGDIELAEFGVLVPVGDPEAMSRAIETMLFDQSLMENYAAKGLRRAMDFDKKVIAGKYIKGMKALMDE